MGVAFKVGHQNTLTESMMNNKVIPQGHFVWHTTQKNEGKTLVK